MGYDRRKKREEREREKKRHKILITILFLFLFLMGGKRKGHDSGKVLVDIWGREQEKHQLVIRYRVNSDNSVGSVTCMRG